MKKNKKTFFEVCERVMDYWVDYDNGAKRMPKYHTCINGNEGVWGCDRSIISAIRDVAKYHPEELTEEQYKEIMTVDNPENFKLVDYVWLGKLSR